MSADPEQQRHGPSRPVIFGTAGHIDHGKTTLVRALTGVDCDRLDEEKRRGITIVLGFAPLTLPDGRLAAIVDVPGHERFVRTMLAGAGGIDVAILVVSAEEGVMPQTREHLAILRLLGVQQLVVALTRIDVVPLDLRELAAMDVAEALAGTPWPGAAVLPVSALTGEGLGALLTAMTEAAARCPRRDDGGAARLPIDRTFAVRGFGTVVTGTLWQGTLSVGQGCELLPSRRAVRIRGLQVHGAARERAVAGERVAVNLQGVDHDAVPAGEWLVLPGLWTPTTRVELDAELLTEAPFVLEDGRRIRVHHGTAEALGSVRLLPRGGEVPEAVLPGASARVLVHLEDPLVLEAGDRVVLRAESPVTTIGGATVIDPLAPEQRRRELLTHERWLDAMSGADGADAVAALLDREPGLTQSKSVLRQRLRGSWALERCLAEAQERGRILPTDERGERWTTTRPVLLWGAPARECVEAFHLAHPLLLGPTLSELRAALPGPPATEVFDALLPKVLTDIGGRCEAGRVRLRPGAPAPDSVQAEQLAVLVRRLDAQGLAPDAIAEHVAAVPLPPDAVPFLVERGDLVRVNDEYVMTHTALAPFVRRLLRHLDEKGSVSPTEFKDLSGLSRKHAIPLLEHLDRIKVTARRGDARVLRERGAW